MGKRRGELAGKLGKKKINEAVTLEWTKMSEIQTEDGSDYQVILGSTRGRVPADVLLGNQVSHRVGGSKKLKTGSFQAKQ